jgi:radical SAM superfamily enzyme YgiQ (UPF0313 family)
MTQVLLVSTYELGERPVALTVAAGALTAAGHDVRALDLAVEEWSDADLAWADVLGCSVPMHTALRLGLAVLDRVRAARPELPVALFGLYAGVAVGLGVLGARDVAISDHVESELVAFADRIERVVSPTTNGERARPLLPSLDRYARLLGHGEERLVGPIEATEGCNHSCRHCPVPLVYGGRSRPIELEQVLAGIDELVALGAGHIHFGDPDFLNRPQHALRVARRLHERHPELSFDATIKVSHLLRFPDVVDELAALGLCFVVSAFESTSDDVLEHLDKGHHGEDLGRAVEVLRAASVEPRPSLLPFTPWTTRADLLELLDFVAAFDLIPNVDPVQYGIRLLLPPGSLLLGVPDDVVLERSLVGYDPAELGYAWRSQDPLLDELADAFAQRAEEAASRDEAIEATYRAIREQCYAAFDLLDPGVPEVRGRRGPAAAARPRLSESWFCCAEPTARQLGRMAAPSVPVAFSIGRRPERD